MNISIITENNYFFNGIKEHLGQYGWLISQITPIELKNTSIGSFENNDILIINTCSYLNELSLLISMNHIVKRIIVIPTGRKLKYSINIKGCILLAEHAGIDVILDAINREREPGVYISAVKSSKLTKREEAILFHTFNGMDAYSIGQRLNISIKTVYAHRRNAYHKLGGRNLFEICAIKGKTINYWSENQLHSVSYNNA